MKGSPPIYALYSLTKLKCSFSLRLFCNALQMIHCICLTWTSKYIMKYSKVERKNVRSRFSWRKNTFTHAISLVSFYTLENIRKPLLGIERSQWHGII